MRADLLKGMWGCALISLVAITATLGMPAFLPTHYVGVFLGVVLIGYGIGFFGLLAYLLAKSGGPDVVGERHRNGWMRALQEPFRWANVTATAGLAVWLSRPMFPSIVVDALLLVGAACAITTLGSTIRNLLLLRYYLSASIELLVFQDKLEDEMNMAENGGEDVEEPVNLE